MNFLFIKALLYRIIRIGIVLFSAWFISGSFVSATTIALFDAVLATGFYYYFDRTWIKIEDKISHLYIKWKYRKMQ